MHLGAIEYFTDEVDGSLYFMDVSWFISLDDQGSAHHMDGAGNVKDKDLPFLYGI